MYLRNGLLFISVLMIGFCLSLYFQSDPSVGSFNWDQYKNLSYHEERSHSLEEFNKKIAPMRLQDLISEMSERNNLAGEKTRIMEIGVGNGRVMMELKKLFPEVEFYGINKEKTHTFYRRESYILTALKFDIMTKPELESMELPFIVFTDIDFGNPIPYKNDKFDLIYSQDTMKHINYKFELWSEVMRVLKPDGISIHTDITGLNIYSDGLVMGPREAYQEMKKKGFNIYVLENPTTLVFKKTDNDHIIFPVTPHRPLPEHPESLSEEQRRPDMGYNLNP